MRFIIDFDENDIAPADAFRMVSEVVALGRISNDGKNYCYVTTFGETGKPTTAVSATKNKASDRFHLYKYKRRA